MRRRLKVVLRVSEGSGAPCKVKEINLTDAARSPELKCGERGNFWYSAASETVYEMPASWMPRFGGWELVNVMVDSGDSDNDGEEV